MLEGDGDVDDVVVVVVGDSDAVVVVDRRSEADRVQDVMLWLLNLVDFAETEQRLAEGPELNFGQIIPMGARCLFWSRMKVISFCLEIFFCQKKTI